MAISVLNHAFLNGNVGGATSGTVNITSTTAGSVLLVAVLLKEINGVAVSSVTDSASNTYTLATNSRSTQLSNGNCEWYYNLAPGAGVTSVKVNLAAALTFPQDFTIFVMEVAGFISPAFDQGDNITNGTESGTDAAGPTDTSLSVPEIFVAAVYPGGDILSSATKSGNPFTGVDYDAHTGGGDAYLVTNGVGSRQCVWTDSSAGNPYGVTVMAVKETSVAVPFVTQGGGDPNPRGYSIPDTSRNFIGPNHQRFNAIDKFFAGPGMAPDYDFPNPTLKKPDLEQRTFIGPNHQKFNAQDKFFGLAGEVPDFDWPNPRIPGRGVDLLTWDYSLLTNTLSLVPHNPFYQLDWPNPLPYRFYTADRTFTSQPYQRFTAQDVFFGSAGQVPDYDWQNPTRQKRLDSAYTWLQNLLQSTLTPPPLSTPFFTTDWPNPRGYAFPFENRSYLNYFVIDDSAPFAQTDWPNPTRLAQVFSNNYNWTESLTTLGIPLPSVQNPFFQTDWPNPTLLKFASDLRTFVSQNYQKYNAQDKFFGVAGEVPDFDWTNPLRARSIDALTWVQNLSQSTLAPLAIPPFFQLDWPNPRVITYRTDPLTWNQTVSRSVLAAKPFIAKDYPNPLIARRTDHLTWLSFLSKALLAGPTTPFIAKDYPNPLIKGRGVDLLTWVQNLQQTTLIPIPLRIFIDAYTKMLNGSRITMTDIGIVLNAYFQFGYFQDDYFQAGHLNMSGNAESNTISVDPKRNTVRLN